MSGEAVIARAELKLSLQSRELGEMPTFLEKLVPENRERGMEASGKGAVQDGVSQWAEEREGAWGQGSA